MHYPSPESFSVTKFYEFLMKKLHGKVIDLKNFRILSGAGDPLPYFAVKRSNVDGVDMLLGMGSNIEVVKDQGMSPKM